MKKKIVKNHKKINKQKRLFNKKIWAVKWTKRKRTQIMRWKKDNLQIFTFKKMFQDNYYFLRLFLSRRLKQTV